jgi:hypothetical protein
MSATITIDMLIKPGPQHPPGTRVINIYGHLVVPDPLPNPHFDQVMETLTNLRTGYSLTANEMPEPRVSILNKLVMDVSIWKPVNVREIFDFLQEQLSDSVETLRIKRHSDKDSSLVINNTGRFKGIPIGLVD